ncbi:hypothetical protein [Clostridium lacusfryxellense]|uniref:hypothetical protein n=1 Tax=Clostridium lacusfryxellense TaxID=205328 RepID=UPI001C0E3404|nr:hypothetical protein [Clostridium lacusfryxellense]MBU3111814.1 hypothetical protein [Clostridium lacusfryxellense]
MIVEKNNFEMYGNTILAPDESFRRRKNEEDLEKSRKQARSTKRLNEIKRKKSVITHIVVCFVVGMIIVARYCLIYNYQEANTKALTQIETLSKENDAYDVDLMKFRNISYIEKAATTRLDMVKPRISDIEYLNLSKNNLGTNESSSVRISSDVMSKIKNIIF